MKPVSSRRKAPPSAGANPALLGQQLLGAGKLNEKDITAIVAAQERTKLRFGDAAIALGLATEADVQEVLARQYEYPISRRDASNFSTALVAADHPFGVRSEAYRTLRTHFDAALVEQRQPVPRDNVEPRRGRCQRAGGQSGDSFCAGGRTHIVDRCKLSPPQPTCIVRHRFRLWTLGSVDGTLLGRQCVGPYSVVEQSFRLVRQERCPPTLRNC